MNITNNIKYHSALIRWHRIQISQTKINVYITHMKYLHKVEMSECFNWKLFWKQNIKLCHICMCHHIQCICICILYIYIHEKGAVIFQLYFSATFDSFNHDGLLMMLGSLGIGGSILSIIKQFLKDRRHRVCVDRKCSNWHDVASGIPQGSVLGPLVYQCIHRWFTSYHKTPNFRVHWWCYDSSYCWRSLAAFKCESVFEWRYTEIQWRFWVNLPPEKKTVEIT